MLARLVLLLTFMASFLVPSRPSQHTLPMSAPIRFDLQGEYIDVRRPLNSNSSHSKVTDEVIKVSKPKKNGRGNRKRKGRSHRWHDLEEDESLERLDREYEQVSRWAVTDHNMRRSGYNRGNRTYNRLPKKNSSTKTPPDNAGRKSNVPKRPGEGWPAGGKYRSVDPRQKKVRRHILWIHNVLRSHVAPPAADMLAVGWYETAAEQAQAWAEQCGTHTESDHPSVRWTSRYGACGQNVLVAPTKRRWSYVLRRWWSGRRHFRFGDDTNNSSIVSAYTQMAWYNSHQLGCGFAECSTTGGSTFFRYVCNYCPSGNDPRRLSRPYTHGQTCRRCPDSCRSMCNRSKCKLCTNACTYSDLWVNCATLNNRWHEWLCNTKTSQGVERFKNCRATCQCMKRIT